MPPLFAPRHKSSALYLSHGNTVLAHHPDADDHVLINTGGPMSTGLTYVGDCKVKLVRCVERLIRTALSPSWDAAAIETFLEDTVSDLDGPYGGRIFEVGLLDSVRQQADFQFSDEYRLLGLKQLVVNAVMAYPWSDAERRLEVLVHCHVVTEANGLCVLWGPPPSNLRVPMRLAARVIVMHVNAAFHYALPLPTDVMTDDLCLAPRPLWAPPPPAPLGTITPTCSRTNSSPGAPRVTKHVLTDGAGTAAKALDF